MNGAKKIQKMTKFEIDNCKKNISFYKDQIRKNNKNTGFYAGQIVLMQEKLEGLQTKLGI